MEECSGGGGGGGGLRTFWYLGYFLKMKAIWSEQWTGHLQFIQIYKIMHWQKNIIPLNFLSYTLYQNYLVALILHQKSDDKAPIDIQKVCKKKKRLLDTT